MGKNTEMLKCFLKVMRNDDEETQKVIPNMYVDNFYNIDFAFLVDNSITNLILDIDGTVLPADCLDVPLKLIELIDDIKRKGINICLVSNNHENRVLPVANKLNVNFLYDAKKPLKEAFDKSLEILNIEDKKIVAMVGDQMMSDIRGANEYGIYSILVKPVSSYNNIQTGTSRFLQNIMENHLKKRNLFDNNIYYKKGNDK